MVRTIVAYFSATGSTKKLAENIAKAADADLFRIVPQNEYTEKDLDWTDSRSRSTVEMKDPASRPGIASAVEEMDAYDVIYLGFPIWWYTAPRIINTFLESYDLSGKTVNVFVTSGGSAVGNTVEDLRASAPGAVFEKAARMSSGTPMKQIEEWIYGRSARVRDRPGRRMDRIPESDP